MRFGLFLSQANKPWSQVLDEFLMAERLGFDHAWLVDHLVDTDGPPENGCLEGWTLLAAIAALTKRIRIGILVSSNTFRHPAVLLKEAVTVDHISHGRVILGIGTGWHEDEHRRYGIDLPAPAERVDRFEEAVELISLLMSQERTTFAGRHYRLDDARLAPAPVQRPRIPILIAAHRPRMLRIAARYADQWDTFAAIPGTATEGIEADLAERIAGLDEACREIGRDPHSNSSLDLGDARGPDVHGRVRRLRSSPPRPRLHRLLDGVPVCRPRADTARCRNDVIPRWRRQVARVKG